VNGFINEGLSSGLRNGITGSMKKSDFQRPTSLMVRKERGATEDVRKRQLYTGTTPSRRKWPRERKEKKGEF
jgi:hypothetical protein